jgi:hypothetical protein
MRIRVCFLIAILALIAAILVRTKNERFYLSLYICLFVRGIGPGLEPTSLEMAYFISLVS